VVTARYLDAHPEEVRDFLDFYWINAYKIAQAIESVFGKGQLSAAKVAEPASKRKVVVSRFLVTDCKKCGTRRPNYTWSKLDFVSMARSTGATGNRIVDAYYLPMEQAHSTAAAVASRLKQKEDGSVTFDYGAERQLAGRTLITAHNLMLDMLTLQKEHFGLSVLEEPLQKCLRDFEEIWAGLSPDRNREVSALRVNEGCLAADLELCVHRRLAPHKLKKVIPGVPTVQSPHTSV
jgi:hypothetical protein